MYEKFHTDEADKTAALAVNVALKASALLITLLHAIRKFDSSNLLIKF